MRKIRAEEMTPLASRRAATPATLVPGSTSTVTLAPGPPAGSTCRRTHSPPPSPTTSSTATTPSTTRPRRVSGPRRRPGAAGREGEGDADHDQPGLVPDCGPEDGGVVGGRVARPHEHLQRNGQHAQRVGQRQADAPGAEIDPEHPAGRMRHPEAAATASIALLRAWSSAASMFSTRGPPPVTSSGLRAVPPPSVRAASPATSTADTPLARRSELT